ncbi:hypothetical protein CNE_1c00170 [Cupriavidus necator N-1]|uniref:Vanillate O-demethylase oxygenase-like C-terminal catalytic domain-containing protein n=1 Tax=Cupriavidus necator (strain ATCC 43291 / DSM 13513 / CCUG 52238 / LMG 8453 / N-1) TaxID=1042878 RepID=G0ERV9_CUPNN|nr:aromatic ring-hydroxylating dioxygenase subunit alpha [Cupriavidus necator]AEI75387.1 hypothetical protein CNE_1c00170 [Cupriavidus necator N-1]MDX6012468.1 aromatic ring-hydroxylating dioxygenase subunit alpha [Cupriavidus necator]
MNRPTLDNIDPALRDDWFVVSAASRVTAAASKTMLLGQPIAIWREHGQPVAASDIAPHARYRAMDCYGFTWVSLGAPQQALFAWPEYGEAQRRHVDCGAIGVKTSGLRMIENFLDMGHFPYVHTGILGQEPHTEVKEYRVAVDDANELWATECRFWQPRAAATAAAGIDVDYVYRVVQPYAALLYKTSPACAPARDVIALFVQPLTECESRAHLMMLLFDETHGDSELIDFQQTIFGQDKPILESQLPARLPLDPRVETSARADASSSAYRRWLRARNVRYGTCETRADAPGR